MYAMDIVSTRYHRNAHLVYVPFSCGRLTINCCSGKCRSKVVGEDAYIRLGIYFSSLERLLYAEEAPPLLKAIPRHRQVEMEHHRSQCMP